MQIQEKIFTYHEVLSSNSSQRLPSSLTLTLPSKEAILFRLLLGTLNITHNFDPFTIKQRTNYSTLGRKTVTRVTHTTVFDCQVTLTDFSAVNTYFSRNRVNTIFFSELLSEFSYYFYQTAKKSHMAAFVHLYRAIEHLSYAFPLLYAKKSNDYKGTYSAMQSFFSNDSNASELKLFREFQKTLIAPSVLQHGQLHFNVNTPDQDLTSKTIQSLMSITTGLDVINNGTQISMYYKDFFSFILNLRNRFFHLLLGSERKNISSKEIYPDLLFKTVNEDIANWVAYLYFELCKYGME
ncbi:hypothetical protein ABEX29_26500 [Brevibacillus porteri]|uniref:hypothetical protein n=1 Tax=Brevibacillus porteri TaxID=2126350 RepID=UPI003D2312AC